MTAREKVEFFARNLPQTIETEDPEVQMMLGLYDQFGGADRLMAILPEDDAGVDAWLRQAATMALSLLGDDHPPFAIGVEAGVVHSGVAEPAEAEPAPEPATAPSDNLGP